tara:strand:- start:2778 stop:3017 length:240 start_codon:yes stop_codon:yes gene_type:complete
MDFIVSYHLYNKIKKNELKESLNNKEMKEPGMVIQIKEQPTRDIISKTCEKCGQEPYFCQCSNNMKLMYQNFNPEKDKY